VSVNMPESTTRLPLLLPLIWPLKVALPEPAKTTLPSLMLMFPRISLADDQRSFVDLDTAPIVTATGAC